MVDSKLADIVAATTPLDGTELVYIVQSGHDRKATAADFGGSGGTTTLVIGTTAISGGPPTTFDSAHKDIEATLSNGDLTVTAGVTFNYVDAFSNKYHSRGKWVFKVTCDTVAGDTGIGFANSYSVLPNNFIGSNADSTGVFHESPGNVYYNNSVEATGEDFTTGDILTFAIDINLGKWWYKVNAGNWNNNVLSDPETGASGYTLHITGNIFFVVSLGTTGEAVTLDFTPAAEEIPFGYLAWDTTDEQVLFNNIGSLDELPQSTLGVRVDTQPVFNGATFFEPAHTDLDGAALSNNNLTVTQSGAAAGAAFVNTSHSEGKWGFSFKNDVVFLPGASVAGFASAYSILFPPYAPGEDVGASTDSIGIIDNGNVFYNNSTTGDTGDGFGAGDTVMVVVDLDNAKFWWKVNAGDWNSDAGADPSTNTGGFSLLLSGDIWVAASPGVGGALTFNFMPDGLPSGFSAWGKAVSGALLYERYAILAETADVAIIDDHLNFAAGSFADLPSLPWTGSIACVTNSSINVWGGTVDGAGTSTVLTWFNGSTWTVIGA